MCPRDLIVFNSRGSWYLKRTSANRILIQWSLKQCPFLSLWSVTPEYFHVKVSFQLKPYHLSGSVSTRPLTLTVLSQHRLVAGLAFIDCITARKEVNVLMDVRCHFLILIYFIFNSLPIRISLMIMLWRASFLGLPLVLRGRYADTVQRINMWWKGHTHCPYKCNGCNGSSWTCSYDNILTNLINFW